MSQIRFPAAMDTQSTACYQLPSSVFAVTGDDGVRKCLEGHANRTGWLVHAFAHASDFLSHSRASGPACLVLDLDLSEADGLNVQTLLRDRQDMPVIFIASCASVGATVRAMKAGALEFLTKPFDAGLLLETIGQALHRSREILAQEARMRVLRDRFELLSCRERQVMRLVATGKLNKQVAGDLGISLVTVQVHRGRVMRKMHATSFANLVNMAAALNVAMEAPARNRVPMLSLVAGRGAANTPWLQPVGAQ